MTYGIAGMISYNKYLWLAIRSEGTNEKIYIGILKLARWYSRFLSNEIEMSNQFEIACLITAYTSAIHQKQFTNF